jgi:phosphoribosylcarboxyaminoimidazole (NCAIR) mutase
MSTRNLHTPEDVLSIASDMPAGYPIGAIDCALSRANAVLILLSGQFDGSDSERLAGHLIANILWSVQGDLALIKKMVKHGYDTSKE